MMRKRKKKFNRIMRNKKKSNKMVKTMKRKKKLMNRKSRIDGRKFQELF